jgi:hypothetical protein
MGLGKERHRFYVRQVKGLLADGMLSERPQSWPLGDVRWPAPLDAPCRLHFPAPLRLMRRDQLIRQPTLTDVIVAACRRIQSLLPPNAGTTWAAITAEAIELSRQTPSSTWVGRRLDLHRYSGRQKRELQINGVSGWLELPAGPGALWPLLAAAQWLHLGKSTVVGLGQLRIE